MILVMYSVVMVLTPQFRIQSRVFVLRRSCPFPNKVRALANTFCFPILSMSFDLQLFYFAYNTTNRITVGYLRAALVNPVDSLRSE